MVSKYYYIRDCDAAYLILEDVEAGVKNVCLTGGAVAEKLTSTTGKFRSLIT